MDAGALNLFMPCASLSNVTLPRISTPGTEQPIQALRKGFREPAYSIPRQVPVEVALVNTCSSGKTCQLTQQRDWRFIKVWMVLDSGVSQLLFLTLRRLYPPNQKWFA